MPEVGLQLRDYFEDVVERVTEEDVRIRAETVRSVRIPDRRHRLRPVAAGAIGFGLATTLLGLVLITDRLFGATSSDSTSGGPAILSEPSPSAVLVMVISVAVGLGLLILGVTVMRRTRLTTQGGQLMQTMEQVDTEANPVDNDTLKLQRRVRLLGWLSGILAIAVVAMGAWMIAGGDSDRPALTAPQEQMEKTLDAYLDAWNAGDGEAVVALMAPGGYHDNGIKYYANDGRLATLVDSVTAQGFSVRSTDRTFVANYVLGRNFTPADSTQERPSIFKMTPDGTQIEWHMAP